MRLAMLLALGCISCAGIPKRPVEFRPVSIGRTDEQALFVCYQDGHTDKLLCLDYESFQAYMRELQRESGNSNKGAGEKSL